MSHAPNTRRLNCTGCGNELTIMEPAPNGWDPLTQPDPSSVGREMKVVGWRLVVRCPDCTTRTVLTREDNPDPTPNGDPS